MDLKDILIEHFTQAQKVIFSSQQLNKLSPKVTTYMIYFNYQIYDISTF